MTAKIPDDMPRTNPTPANPVDGWEVSFVTKPELGILRIAKAPGKHDPRIGLFIRKEELMFPLAYFKNWHAAKRFVAWMEGAAEPEPTMEEEFRTAMAELADEPTDQLTQAVDERQEKQS